VGESIVDDLAAAAAAAAVVERSEFASRGRIPEENLEGTKIGVIDDG